MRLYKTRSQAGEACKKGQVKRNGHEAKASAEVAVGDVIELRRHPITYTYRVEGILQKRVGAPLARENYTDLTSPEERARLDTIRQNAEYRPRGQGRPTKKERRTIDKFKRYGP